MKYIKLPVLVDAFQYTGNIFEAITWARKLPRTKPFVEFEVIDGVLIIPTLEGNMVVDKNDWIIRGVDEEFYPCKPHIFERTYVKMSNVNILGFQKKTTDIINDMKGGSPDEHN